MSYTQSKSWVSAETKARNKLRELNTARQRMSATKSCAWPRDYDLDEHATRCNADLREQRRKQEERDRREAERRIRLGLSLLPTIDLKPALGGKQFGDNFSPVLCRKTVFTPEYNVHRTQEDYPGRVPDFDELMGDVEPYLQQEKPLPDWPSRAEAKYEGDERISTDVLHGRFLGAPRVQGNETVSWMQRSIIMQYSLEEFYRPAPNEIDIFLRGHWIPELEFDDEEGRQTVGSELMEMLDE